MFQKSNRKSAGSVTPWALSAATLALLAAPAPFLQNAARASDHADTAENVSRPGADLSDVYIFPSASSSKNVVLVMSARPLIPKGQGNAFSFDPRVLYQFKIDKTGDNIEDLVIQVRFEGTGTSQKVFIAGPAAPPRIGNVATLLPNFKNPGTINKVFGDSFFGGSSSDLPVTKLFAGAREDSFFFDFERFTFNKATQEIFPDRRTPLEPPLPRTIDKTIPNPNQPLITSWRPSGEARDFFEDFNVLSIVIELPRAALGGGIIRLWETTSVLATNGTFTQQDRLARPLTNEVLATVSNNRHKINNRNNPTNDKNQLVNDIESFLTFPAGRSREIKDVIKAVLVPDVMIADLSKSGPATYLGVETAGKTGGLFGGRALTDDIIDISLGIVFGTTISDLDLADPDGNEIPSLTSDNVGSGGKQFKSGFPYLGSPR